MGHSSGAHISMLYLIRAYEAGQAPSSRVCGYVGLSGVYDITSHFEYESMRGVEVLSPMQAAAGHTVAAMRHCSPTLLIQQVWHLQSLLLSEL
jgi:acetyl esterase/lipase